MIDTIDRRIRHALSAIRRPFRAKCLATNTAPGVSLVQAEGVDGETLQAIEEVQQYGFTSHAPAGADRIVLPLGGATSHGVVIATEHATYRLKSLAAGEVALYTDEGDKVVLKRGRIIEITTETLRINASTKVEVNTPLLDCSGDVKGQGTSLHGHTHGGVQAGGSNTSVPN